jgi:hypothetical protein
LPARPSRIEKPLYDFTGILLGPVVIQEGWRGHTAVCPVNWYGTHRKSLTLTNSDVATSLMVFFRSGLQVSIGYMKPGFCNVQDGFLSTLLILFIL